MQSSNNHTDQNRQYADDEIDLFELFENLWKQKILIVLITVSVTLAGIVYALMATPVYKASASLKPMASADLKPLRDLTLYPDLSADSLLKDYVTILYSSEFLLSFAKKSEGTQSASLYESDSAAGQLKAVQERLDIKETGTKQENAIFPYQLEFSANTALLAAAELNRLLNDASLRLRKDLEHRHSAAVANETRRLTSRLALLKSELENARNNEIARLEEQNSLKLAELEDQLAAQKAEYRKRLEDRIQSLEEAHAIATSLEITEPVALNQLGRQPSSRVEILADIRGQNEPLYLRGSRLLSAELGQLKSRSPDFYPDSEVRNLESQIAILEHNRRIEILKARESDTPFSTEINNIKARLATIESESFPENLQLDFANAPAAPPADPIKPRKALIAVLSLVLGGMLAIMVALVRAAIQNRQNRRLN